MSQPTSVVQVHEEGDLIEHLPVLLRHLVPLHPNVLADGELRPHAQIPYPRPKDDAAGRRPRGDIVELELETLVGPPAEASRVLMLLEEEVDE